MSKNVYSPEYAEALEICRSEWTPPGTTATPLDGPPRLPLNAVVDFLAFDEERPPSRLLCAAYRKRAFTALCAAAADNKVDLYGLSAQDNVHRRIESSAFTPKLSLGGEENAIYPDLGVVAIEHYVELRRDPNPWICRAVYVDRASLMRWLSGLPGKAQRKARAKGMAACTKWLVNKRMNGPQAHKKAQYKEITAAQFGVGPDQFRTAWKAAAAQEPRADWGQPGAPKKKNHPFLNCPVK